MSDVQSVTTGNSLRNIFGEELVKAAAYKSFIVVDADVAGGTGVDKFREAYPNRFIQCGISEQAMIGVASGYAMTAHTRVFATTFAQFGARGWEPFSLLAAQNPADVTLVLSHVGLDVGPDGSSAQSLSHYALWRSMPLVEVYHPYNSLSMARVIDYVLRYGGPNVILTGRSPIATTTPNVDWDPNTATIISYTDERSAPSSTLIVTAGNTVDLCNRVAKTLGIDLAIITRLTGQDKYFAQYAATHYDKVYVVEDAYPYGGLFGIVAERLASEPICVHSIGVEDWWGSGEPDELWLEAGLTEGEIRQIILSRG